MTRSVHFIGICGKGMGAIAGALARAGWQVTGCDENPKDPMLRYLACLGIPITTPCRVEDLPAPSAGVVLVVGKRIPDDHPVLVELRRRKQEWTSFPAFLARHFLSRSRNAVVAGGVGKTTTTSMLAWILQQAGLDPDYIIGGFPRGFPDPARLTGSPHAVIEGDEYASCGNDPRPKFLHYHPEVVVVTNVLEDHPDLYENIDAVKTVFAGLIALLPAGGCLVVPDDDKHAADLARQAPCRVITVGFSEAADCRITPLAWLPTLSSFSLDHTRIDLPMCGRMNARNAAMAVVAARQFGVDPVVAARALASFAGVDNRQESRTTGSVEIVTDKATHPEAIQAMLESVRQRFPGRRIVSFLQPRATGGKSWVYQKHLPAALATADLVMLFPAYEHQPKPGQEWAGGAFDMNELAAAIRSLGTRVEEIATIDALFHRLPEMVQADDVLVVSVPEQAGDLKLAIVAALDGAFGAR